VVTFQDGEKSAVWTSAGTSFVNIFINHSEISRFADDTKCGDKQSKPCQMLVNETGRPNTGRRSLILRCSEVIGSMRSSK